MVIQCLIKLTQQRRSWGLGRQTTSGGTKPPLGLIIIDSAIAVFLGSECKNEGTYASSDLGQERQHWKNYMWHTWPFLHCYIVRFPRNCTDYAPSVCKSNVAEQIVRCCLLQLLNPEGLLQWSFSPVLKQAPAPTLYIIATLSVYNHRPFS